MRLRKPLLVLATLAALAGLPANAAILRNAQVVERSASQGLDQAVRQIVDAAEKPVWIAYDVPSSDPDAIMCCFASVDAAMKSVPAGHCVLEKENSSFTSFGDERPRPLVSHDSFSVFMRVENRTITKIRTLSADCGADAGGLPVYLIRGVNGSESVTWLDKLADELYGAGESTGTKKKKRGGNESQHAIAAIALHRAPNAIDTLDRMVHSNRPEGLRGHAAFWLGSRGGKRGIDSLRALIGKTESEDLREQAIAGIAQSEEPEAVTTLLALARNDRSSQVRKQSIFWLGQRAGEKVAAELKEAADDPEEEVREMAVFAISQLPADRAVPALIELAHTHKSRGVREKAVFWLGQSGDPRALDAIEKILTK